MRRRFFASKSSDIYGFMYYYQDGTVDNKYINKPLNGILIGPFQASGVNQYFVLSHDFEYVTMLGDAYQIKYTSMCLYDKDIESYNNWFFDIQRSSYAVNVWKEGMDLDVADNIPGLGLAFLHKLKVLGVDVFPFTLPCIWIWDLIMENIDLINEMIYTAGGVIINPDGHYWMLDGCYFPSGMYWTGSGYDHIRNDNYLHIRGLCLVLENMIIK